MEKRKTAIEKVVLNTPIYNDEKFEPTYINFFFGRNGAGKSTIAKALMAGDGVQWKTGRTADDYNVLIYDQDFISGNFADYENLPGVFTMGEVNIKTQKEVDVLKRECDAVIEELGKLNDEMDEIDAEKEKLLSKSQDVMMKLADPVKKEFQDALKGMMIKKKFCPEVVNKQPIEHELEELRRLYAVAYDKKATSYPLLKYTSDISGRYDFSAMQLLREPIVSSSNTQFAKFIKNLGAEASDWVKEGHARYVKHTNGVCPFCQQTLPSDFERQIIDCFDKQYQNNCKAIEALQAAYQGKMREIIKVLDTNRTNGFMRISWELYDAKLEQLKARINLNLVSLQKKVDTPSIQVELENVDTLFAEIDKMIREFNEQIKANNDGVADVGSTKRKFDQVLWEHLAYLVQDELLEYKKQDAVLNKKKEEIEKKKRNQKDLYQKKNEIIKAKAKATVDTETAYKNMNQMIMDSGFQGFKLQPKRGVKNVYEVIRDDGKPAKKLSEGERNFIAFLYFYNLVRGNGRADSAIIGTDGSISDAADRRDKIVIIDDPVSSMDSGTLFIVSAMVRDMINICHNNVEYLNLEIQGNYIKQIFILTHNAYFHREITYNQVDYYDMVSFYMIHKSDNISTVKLCEEKAKEVSQKDRNINPVQNAYTALWTEFRELNSTIPLLNVIRRILEYYFMELCGYKGTGVRDNILKEHKDDFMEKNPDGTANPAKYHLASSMLAYIDNHASLIDGFNLVLDITDPQQYRDTMKLIFEKMNQSQHYKMMMGE